MVEEERWMEGRDRPVRVYLTEEEHALVRQAAALADKSVSRFSIEAIVGAARAQVGSTQSSPPPAADEPAAKKRGKKK
jgi:uncharacterized protein (DUF1778 family)